MAHPREFGNHSKAASFRFYPNDWLGNPFLTLCSLAAQGLWLRLLCHAHKNDRRGYVQNADGTPYSIAQLARLAGRSEEEVTHALTELESFGILSRTRSGVIYSRRMVREQQRRGGARRAHG
jgi:hypothetical protein